MRFFTPSLVLIGAALVALTVARAAEPEQRDASQTIQEQTQLGLRFCANIWTIKTHGDLDKEVEYQRKKVKDDQASLERELAENPKLIKGWETEVERLKKAADASLLKTVEDAAKTGLEVTFTNSGQIAKAVSTNFGNESDIDKLHKAEAKLEALRKKDAAQRAYFAGLPAMMATIESCVKDQREYLGRRPIGTDVTPTDTTTTATMKGTWTVTCTDKNDASTIDLSGGFELYFTMTDKEPGKSGVSGELSLGEDKMQLTGTWFKDKKTITANSFIEGKPWTFSGSIVTSQGQLVSAGAVSGDASDTMSCKGTYNGQTA